jgi:hypothetical protein
MALSTHEDLSRQLENQGPSDRSFGWLFAVFLALVGVWPLFHGRGLRPWALALAGAFALVSVVRPGLLHQANVWWMRFGLLLSRVVNPIVMAVLFYGVIAPIGWLKRRFGEDSLRLRRDAAAASYWIERHPPGPKPETMSRQF